MTAAALWLRVSTIEQDATNQRPDLERFAAHHGYEITTTYELAASAWNGGKDGGEYRTRLEEALRDAHQGRYQILCVWALDRLTRGGAEDALRILRQFRERGVMVVSYQEPWLVGSPQIQDVLVAFAGWVAEQESARRSERVKAGLAKRRATGKPMGGAASKRGPDKHKRSTKGYREAWGPAGARRKAAE